MKQALYHLIAFLIKFNVIWWKKSLLKSSILHAHAIPMHVQQSYLYLNT